MASYNARNRDPLLDSTTQAAIERRSKELIGIALILLGLASAAMIWSYTPDDPNWMVSTDAPVQNWMAYALPGTSARNAQWPALSLLRSGLPSFPFMPRLWCRVRHGARPTALVWGACLAIPSWVRC
jgi:hypothetical protein